MYPGYPELFMQLNKKNEFHYQPDWYRGIEYPKEQERGYDFNEDLYVPGYFEVDIKKGESIVFSAGISEISPRKLKQTFEAEVADRTPRDSFYHCLQNSAHQFHNKQGENHYVLAGYPWFKCRARDLFVSLPGLTLAVDEQDEFEDVMVTAEKAIREFQLYLSRYPYSMRKDKVNTYMDEMRDKLSYKAYLSAKNYYLREHYKAAVISLQNCLKDYPGSKYREEIMYMLFVSKYQMAVNSVEDKKVERYNNAREEYYYFADEYPNSRYAADVKKMYEDIEAYLENYKFED